ncbi:MAG: hypothetical protein M3Q83_02700 [Pseudomonadota bacterium]|nr:hypothetical protein [Pseudomonadota bacterium]
MLDIFMEVAGWIGALLILAAYGLLSAGKLDARSPAYQWLNVVGAVGFILNSGWNGAWPSAALNVVWVGIGAVALVRIFGRRRAVAPDGSAIG